jgi:hypothetical protein
LSVDAFASQQASTWKEGLAAWDQGAERITRLRAAADVRVYTPGSRAGTPLALLNSLRAAPGEHAEDSAARVSSTAASLLTLAGLSAPGPPAREHALVSAILAAEGPTTADLPWLVQQIQRPPFEQIGVLDLETFYPARDRQELALRFNSVLAAPGFDIWMSGEPLDIGRMLHGPAGRPCVSIVSIAHLGDAERMLTVSMVLDAVLDWTRRQGGTSSLRAMIYMDEVFGYLPPVSNPPSKLPLLTLLKQARAFGVGIVLATQNPVDLDYKALSNTGTWFLGKLQTERDKARVLDGIESLASGALDRHLLDRSLSALPRRVFFMHNVHEPQPLTFETRWTLSYLRGPMTRDDLTRALALGRDSEPDSHREAAPAGGAPSHRPALTPSASSQPGAGSSTGMRPVVPAGIREAFLAGEAGGSPSVYAPVLYGAARVHYADTRRGVEHTASIQAITPIGDNAVAVDWERAAAVDEGPDSLEHTPATQARYRPLPSAALQPKTYATWTRDFERWLQRSQSLRLLHAPSLDLISRPGESERDFRVRLQLAAHELRDASIEKLRARYAPKVERLSAKVRSAEEALGREEQQAQQQTLQSAVSIGATMLGALMGRKTVSISNLGRATTAARGVGRSVKESQDIARAKARLEEARQALAELERNVDADVAQLAAASDPPLDTIEVKPKREGVEIRLVTLAWKPVG